MSVGAEIKRIRELNGLSVRKIAALIGIDGERLRKWEQKDLNPRYEDANKIEQFFKVPISDLYKIEKIQFSSISIPANIKSEAKDLGQASGSYVNKTGNQFIELSEGRYIMNTSLVTKKAYAGYLAGWGDDEYVKDLPIHPIIVEKPHLGEYRSFEVDGDSMDDGTSRAIQKGDIVTGRKIDRTFWKSKLHLKKYSEFVIVSLDGIIVKEIIDHNTSTETITCHSLNPDKEHYPDFELSLGKVMQIFNVVQVTKKR